MKDLIQVNQDIPIPLEWDYDSSVGRCRNLFKEVREKGAEGLTELYIAHEILTKDSKRKVDRKYPNKSFAGYCEEIEIDEWTGYRYLHSYFNLPRRPIPAIAGIAPPEGKYRTIIIDPPWPIEKIEREVRPNQVNMDYPLMSLADIGSLPVKQLAFEDGAHIYLWTTHKHLPNALSLFISWDVKYQCLLTWVKNVGMTPFSWMYSTEHVLFGHIGSLPLVELGKRLDFQAKVREHSRKPEAFYQLVRVVSPEPRLDMFAREEHKGFIPWGNEKGKWDTTKISD